MELEGALEIKEGGNNSFSYTLPGKTKYADLVLKRGMVVGNSALYNWFQTTINGNLDQKIETKDISITLLNGEGNAHVKWSVRNSYPKKISVSTMNAKASGENAIMIETLTLSYSEFVRENL
jgi:phage tail-like protein